MKKVARIVAVAGLALSVLSSGHNVSARPLPADLIVSNVMSYVGPDGAEMLRVLIKNQGQGPAGAFNVTTKGTGGNNLNKVYLFNGLAAGAQTSFSYTPGPVTGCDFTRTFIADGANQVAESNEGNNSKTFNAAYCSRPDLVLTTQTLNPGSGVNEGQKVIITNLGTVPAHNVVVDMKATAGQFTSGSLGPITVNPGEPQSMVFFAGAQCDYTMTFTVDPADVVDEYNEMNNVVNAVDSCN